MSSLNSNHLISGSNNAADQQELSLTRKMTRRLQSSADVTSQQDIGEWTTIEENNNQEATYDASGKLVRVPTRHLSMVTN